MTDAVREAFERWMSEDGKWPDAVAHRYGHYVLAHTESAWKAWQAALSEQPCEPDMRHPKIQALIGSNARRSIELSLVQQLLDDPDCDLTAQDMEYWNGLHDKLRERLTAAHPAPVERVTLSDEQIIDATEHIDTSRNGYFTSRNGYFIHIARAVIAEYERANGIGKGEQA